MLYWQFMNHHSKSLIKKIKKKFKKGFWQHFIKQTKYLQNKQILAPTPEILKIREEWKKEVIKHEY